MVQEVTQGYERGYSMVEPSERMIFIYDETETFINSDTKFPDVQKRILYDAIVDFVTLTQSDKLFYKMLKDVYDYIKGIKADEDSAQVKSKILAIMLDSFYSTFGIEKINGLKIQIDKNYDEQLIEYCKDMVTYEFDELIRSENIDLEDYEFTDYKINKTLAYICAAYTDAMYKFVLYIYYQSKLDPSAQEVALENIKVELNSFTIRSFDFLVDPREEDIYISYEFSNIFSDKIDVEKLNEWFCDDLQESEIITVHVNYSTLYVLKCIEEHIKKSHDENHTISAEEVLDTMYDTHLLYEIKKFNDTVITELYHNTVITCCRELSKYEQFFVVYEKEVTEDTLPDWREAILEIGDKLDEVWEFIKERIFLDEL